MSQTFNLTPHETVTVREHSPEALVVEGNWSSHGSAPPPHLHPGQDERFEVIEGELTAVVDGAERRLGAGDTLEVPRGAVHKMWNSGGGDHAGALAHLPRGPDARVVRGARRAEPPPPARARRDPQPHADGGAARRVRRRDPAVRRPEGADGPGAVGARCGRPPAGALGSAPRFSASTAAVTEVALGERAESWPSCYASAEAVLADGCSATGRDCSSATRPARLQSARSTSPSLQPLPCDCAV